MDVKTPTFVPHSRIAGGKLLTVGKASRPAPHNHSRPLAPWTSGSAAVRSSGVRWVPRSWMLFLAIPRSCACPLTTVGTARETEAKLLLREGS